MKTIAVVHVAPSVLRPAPYNPRKMAPAERARLERGIREFGLVDPIIARRADNLVIGGHQRLNAALAIGLASVPVVYLDDLSDDRAAALNVLLNNPAAAGEWDMAKLTDLLSELDGNGFDATLTGFDESALEELLAWTPDVNVAANEPATVETPVEPITRVGDVWVMGEHRLTCGDSSVPAVVARAINGRAVGAYVFDPPFEAQELIRGADLDRFSAPDVFVFGDCMYPTARSTITTLPWRFGFVWDGVTRWVIPGKPLLAHKTCEWFSATGEYDHEKVKDPRVVETKPQKGTNKRGAYEIAPDPRGKSLASVFRSPVTAESHGAEHSKPVLWFALILGNCSRGLIYDGFAGSGTSLLAAEQLGRVWAGVELNPAHCDVIVGRWETMTGKTAERISGGQPAIATEAA